MITLPSKPLAQGRAAGEDRAADKDEEKDKLKEGDRPLKRKVRPPRARCGALRLTRIPLGKDDPL